MSGQPEAWTNVPLLLAFSMLTRGQVAKRLGKSIATVRRMEGRELHPRRDAGGVFRFDSVEVDALLHGDTDQQIAGRRIWLDVELGAREGQQAEAGGSNDARAVSAEDFEARVRAAVERVVREEFTRRDGEQARRKAERQEREQAEALAACSELLALLESSSESELAALAEDPEFTTLLDELSAAD